MSIKMKLLVSYIGMILIPVLLITFTSHLIATLVNPPRLKQMQGEIFIGFNFRHVKSKQLFQSLSNQVRTQPDNFTNPDYLQKFETEHNLTSLKMGLIAIRNHQTTYTSHVLPQKLLKELQRKKTGGFRNWRHVQNQAYSFEELNFISANGEPCILYLIANLTYAYRFGKTIFILIPAALILFIILTNGLLTYCMSRNLIRPLKALQNATEQIKAGNLDFQIPIGSKDELGKLAEAFEEMRSRLKESLEVQLQYELNRKELIAGISHDLKTPVTCIKGYVEGILDGVAATPSKIQHYLQTIQAKTNSLDRLIDELFLFSKLDLGKLPFHFETVQLHKLLEDFFHEMELELKERNITFNFKADREQQLLVKADRENLVRVLHNLIENSVKYMTDRTDPQITLAIQTDPLFVTITVSDNGRGIAPLDLPFIFDSFFRADRTRNPDIAGTGLGLAIAKLIITGHGGKIWADSCFGQGTSVSFRLPKLLK